MKVGRKSSRFAALFLALAMLLSVITACSATPGAAATTPAASEAPSAAPVASEAQTSQAAVEPTAANPYEKTIKLTFSTVDGNKAGLKEDGSVDANFDWFTKKFNVQFEFLTLDWSNYVDQTRLWMSSGSAPDLMMLDIDVTRYPEYLDWVKQGLLRAYPDFAGKYPNLEKRMDAMKTGKKFYVDGKLYAWPAYLDMSQYNYRQVNLPYYRKDWARKVGQVQENDEYTWDQWLALIKEVQKQDPGANGAGQTIGLTGVSWMFPEYFGAGAYNPYLQQFHQVDGKWTWGPAEAGTIEVLKLTKQLYDEGVIFKDQPLVKDDTAKDPFVSGKAFAFIGGNVTVGGLKSVATDMVKVNPDFKPETDLAVAYVKGPTGKLLVRETPDQWSQQAMNATVTDEQADRWLAICDYMVSDEGYYFRNLGIPEKDWKLNADGKPEAQWPKDDAGQPVYPYANGTWPWIRAFGCNDGFDLISPANPKWAQDVAAKAYERVNQSDVDVVPLNPDLSYYSAPLWDQKGQNIASFSDFFIKTIVEGGDLDAKLQKYVADNKTAADAILAEMQTNLK